MGPKATGTAGPILPQVLSMEVRGFDVVFTGPIDLTVQAGLNVILGGNGLGKTTLLQALVFGLTGGANEAVAEEKSSRWNHLFFSGRFNLKKDRPTVEVCFKFAENRIWVRRGFTGDALIGFKNGSEGWIEDSSTAEKKFETVIRSLGGYRSLDDFKFVVHRLLYMPESRQLLAWDTDAQTRLIMLLSQSSINEEHFRAKRAELKELDSQKRHLHVAIGKLLGQEKVGAKDSEKKDEHHAPLSRGAVDKLALEIKEIAKERHAAERELATATEKLSRVSSELETLRREIESSEASAIATSLSKHEELLQLPIYELLHKGTCPNCGETSQRLQDAARRFAAQRKCCLCGEAKASRVDGQLQTLHTRLEAKHRAQNELSTHLVKFRDRALIIRQREQALFSKINTAQIAQRQAVMLVERGIRAENAPAPDLEEYQRRHDQLELQCLDLEKYLSDQYSAFYSSIANQTERLRMLYKTYATAFLGIECELVETKAHDRFLDLKLFIPSFNNTVRPKPTSCSEAQRFFLDIAFRMALVDLFQESSNRPGTFLCETPETALDLSYLSNVATMFKEFTKNHHAVLLSANIQRHGIAAELFRSVPKSEKPQRVLNLLAVGRLSDVQKKAEKRLGLVVKAILR